MPAHQDRSGSVLRSAGTGRIFEQSKAGALRRFEFTIDESSTLIQDMHADGTHVFIVDSRPFKSTQLIDAAIGLQFADIFSEKIENLNVEIEASSVEIPNTLASGYLTVVAENCLEDKLTEVVVRHGEKVVVHIYVKHRPILHAGDHFDFGGEEYVVCETLDIGEELESRSKSCSAADFIEYLVAEKYLVKIKRSVRIAKTVLANQIHFI